MNRPDIDLAAPWQFPTPTVTLLSNGLTVWHFHLPGQHIATFEAIIPVPLGLEPQGKEGVATVALHAADEGTHRHPDGAIGELLEAQGATLHGHVRYRHTTFGGQAPSRRLPEVLRLFAEVLTEPAYAAADVDHHVEAQIAAHSSNLAAPGSVTRIALRAALYDAQHRDSRPVAGSPESLAALTPADVIDWHRRHYTPEGATIVMAGSLSAEETFAALESWRPTGVAPSTEGHTPSPSVAPRVVVVDRPDAVQATMTFATRTVTRSDPRWPALRVAGHAMAGAFASRLNLELRERLGYTYGIHGGFAAGVDEGQFSVGGAMRTEVAGDAVARVLDALALGTPFSDAEIDDARRFLVGVAPLANETSADVVSQAATLAAAGMDPGYLDRHLVDVGRVTAQEATTAFREVIAPDGMTLAITGPATALVPALTDAGLSPHVVDL